MSKEVLEESLLLTRSGAGRRPILGIERGDNEKERLLLGFQQRAAGTA